MVQGLAVVVMVVLVVEMLKVNCASASVLSLYIVSVFILLYRKMRPRADVADMLMIPAFGEILVSADRADGARPPLSSTHYGLQPQCGAGVDQRSAVFGSPAQLASPIRLGSMSARQSAEAARPARSKGKRYGRLCQLLSPEGPLSNRHRLPSGLSP